MANFLDIMCEAYEKGILLDGSGNAERYYTFGAFVNLSGSKPEDFIYNPDMCKCTIPSDKDSVLKCEDK